MLNDKIYKNLNEKKELSQYMLLVKYYSRVIRLK
jgi:hypothetical protein